MHETRKAKIDKIFEFRISIFLRMGISKYLHIFLALRTENRKPKIDRALELRKRFDYSLQYVLKYVSSCSSFALLTVYK